MEDIHRAWEWSGDGRAAVAARCGYVDALVQQLWRVQVERDASLAARVTVAAVGGYGRGELFPHSDVDLLFCVARGDAPKAPIRNVTQQLWDCGMRMSPVTRLLRDCERLEADNLEFAIALLDRRWVAGDQALYAKLDERGGRRMVQRDGKAMRAELMALTAARHARYGNTLFHLEPNIKECPGGLRDVHAVGWLQVLAAGVGLPAVTDAAEEAEFAEARSFLSSLRCFLHWRAGRDENTLDWTTQDAAAAAGVGLGRPRVAAPVQDDASPAPRPPGAAAWMRAYYRHARVVERRLERAAELGAGPPSRLRLPARATLSLPREVRLVQGALLLGNTDAEAERLSGEPDAVLGLYAVMAVSGARLELTTERRVSASIPLLGTRLEDGPGLWRHLAAILKGRYAGVALRSMHALGLLDLLLPEFHGIDALVIRDAYHRYTVDEHTFVVIDTLHELAELAPPGAPEWRTRLGVMMRELLHPELLYLAALLHDTGKGRASGAHAEQSAGMAEAVLARWEMDAYDAGQVVSLIRHHLEMSAALRRDIFDTATVRAFAARMETHEALRMLTLFTYADIQAVHPDALTPWKAENLWRLSMSAANQMDRGVDEERVRARGGGERLKRVLAAAGPGAGSVELFLQGFPERYLSTRSPDGVLEQWAMAQKLQEDPFQLALHVMEAVSGAAGADKVLHDLTLVTRDRASLFAALAGALAAWGMEVVTADGFTNGGGVVVDSFRFADVYGTLRLNEDERARFVASVRAMLAGSGAAETMLAGRKRSRRKAPRVPVESRVDFDDDASVHSTLLQVMAQDVPGLLRAVSRTLDEAGCNVEVALVDTEGETAIDVFYLTQHGGKLQAAAQHELRSRLLVAIRANAT